MKFSHTIIEGARKEINEKHSTFVYIIWKDLVKHQLIKCCFERK